MSNVAHYTHHIVGFASVSDPRVIIMCIIVLVLITIVVVVPCFNPYVYN